MLGLACAFQGSAALGEGPKKHEENRDLGEFRWAELTVQGSQACFLGHAQKILLEVGHANLGNNVYAFSKGLVTCSLSPYIHWILLLRNRICINNYAPNLTANGYVQPRTPPYECEAPSSLLCFSQVPNIQQNPDALILTIHHLIPVPMAFGFVGGRISTAPWYRNLQETLYPIP